MNYSRVKAKYEEKGNVSRAAGRIMLFFVSVILAFFAAVGTEAYADDGMLVVVIDPGHGGTDYGATSVGGLNYQEKILNFKLAEYLQYELSRYDGVTVALTRYADYKMTYAERATYAEKVGADVVISLHFNSSTDRQTHGAGVCVSGMWEYTLPDLGQSILNSLSENLGVDITAGVYTRSSQTQMWDDTRMADYSGLMRENGWRGIPTVSVEHCYLTSFDDLIYYNSDSMLQEMAEADAQGIASYYGLQLKNESSSITRTYDEAYMSGYDDGTFRPLAYMTRAETAALLARLSDGYDPNTQYQTTLSDVYPTDWYYNYVAYMNSIGFITGDVYGTYRPNEYISRAEFAILACRYLGLQESDGASGFADCAGHMADGYIAALRRAGFAEGDENGEFQPFNPMSRSSMVMIMNRILERSPACPAEKQNPFSDIDPSYWAYDDILEATVSHNVG